MTTNKMTTNKDEDNYTTLVGVKWDHESMLQVHEMMWDSYIKKLVKSKKIRINQKLERLDTTHNWMNHIRNMCINKELAIKKK